MVRITHSNQVWDGVEKIHSFEHASRLTQHLARISGGPSWDVTEDAHELVRRVDEIKHHGHVMLGLEGKLLVAYADQLRAQLEEDAAKATKAAKAGAK